MTVCRILVLGGYGNFGKRIVESLSEMEGVTIFVAGRNVGKAERLCQEVCLNSISAVLKAVAIDIYNSGFVNDLKILSPDLVIHTSGPFQGQSYRVPEACITIGSHYIDLADDRRFVCDISSLNERAAAKNLLIVSGASTVPGLSSSVVDHFRDDFSRLDKIDFAIAPGNQAERGEATVRGILSYTGHPFPVFSRGKWENRYGWMSARKLNFGAVIGKRWLANVNVPDLELFPKRYRSVNTVNFQAGLELPFLHLTMVFMAFLVRIGLVKNWSFLTRQIFKCSELFDRFGTNSGGMQINIIGLNENGVHKHIKWTLCAENGVGPHIPIISAIIIAKKMITGDLDSRGAIPCLGMYTLEEFDREAAPLGTFYKTEDGIG